MPNNKKYSDALKIMVVDIWKDENPENRENALQTLVDARTRSDLGVEDICKVVPEDLSDDTLAQYVPSKRQVQVRRESIEKGVVEFSNGESFSYARPLVELVFQMMHEVRHAEQHYLIEHPDVPRDGILNMLQYNEAFNKSKATSIYFDTDKCPNEHDLAMATCLYALQPVERDAYLFAQEAADEFCEKMHEIYPNNPDFTYPYQDNPLDDYQWQAMIFFKTGDPERDIDNVLLTINGCFVEESLNLIVCNVVEGTQKQLLHVLLKENQARNLEIAERIELGKRFAENEEIDLDDPFQDITERR